MPRRNHYRPWCRLDRALTQGGLMKLEKIVKATALALFTAGIVAYCGTQLVSKKVHAEDDADSEAQLAAIGLRIAPSFINMEGKDPALVGLGSFIVNAQSDCNGCHGSDPATEFSPPANPFWLGSRGQAKINQATYLNGG